MVLQYTLLICLAVFQLLFFFLTIIIYTLVFVPSIKKISDNSDTGGRFCNDRVNKWWKWFLGIFIVFVLIVVFVVGSLSVYYGENNKNDKSNQQSNKKFDSSNRVFEDGAGVGFDDEDVGADKYTQEDFDFLDQLVNADGKEKALELAQDAIRYDTHELNKQIDTKTKKLNNVKNKLSATDNFSHTLLFKPKRDRYRKEIDSLTDEIGDLTMALRLSKLIDKDSPQGTLINLEFDPNASSVYTPPSS
jgi:hypothetical protein